MPEQEYLTVDHLTTKELTRIFSKIKVTAAGCWEWQGKRNKGGYGSLKFRGRDENIHRVVYAWAVEPLPRRISGQKTPQIDHIVCSNPPCCNPVHLKLVTPKENSLRSNNAAALNSRKTHCLNGHLLPLEAVGKGTYGRECRQCKRDKRASETPEQREHRRQQVAGYEQRQRYGPNREEWVKKRNANYMRWWHNNKSKASQTSKTEVSPEVPL